MSQEFSVCGLNCSACEHYMNSKCSGCAIIKGKVWWAGYISVETCPIYNCVVNEHELKHCGKCPEIPCRLWRDMKDPSFTDEQHEAGIKERAEYLKRLL